MNHNGAIVQNLLLGPTMVAKTFGPKNMGFIDFCIYCICVLMQLPFPAATTKFQARNFGPLKSRTSGTQLYSTSFFFVSGTHVCTAAKEVNFINVFLYICYCSAMEGSDAVKPYQSKIKIWFETTERAEMVRQCMEVDEELQPARLVKEMHVEGSYLVM
jgi:hypothetical protein